MKKLLLVLLLASPLISRSQSVKFRIIDAVEVKNQFEKEALYFYDQNWKLFREEALKQGVISGYSIERGTKSDSSFVIVLNTEFENRGQLENVEKNFEPILKALRPDGPLVLGDGNYRNYVISRNSYWTEVISSD